MRDKQAEKVTSQLIDELTRIRKEKRISHERLAEMSGLNRSTISLVENKRRNPTLLTVLKISRALDVKLSELIASLGE